MEEETSNIDKDKAMRLIEKATRKGELKPNSSQADIEIYLWQHYYEIQKGRVKREKDPLTKATNTFFLFAILKAIFKPIIDLAKKY